MHGEWTILVIETVGHRGDRYWGPVAEVAASGSFEKAAGRAEQLAWDHLPEHPFSIRERRVYRADDRTWLVVASGGSRESVFEVRIVEPVADQGPRFPPGAVV